LTHLPLFGKLQPHFPIPIQKTGCLTMLRLAWQIPLIVVLVAAGLVGCGKTEGTQPAAQTDATQTGGTPVAGPPKQVPADATPDQVVTVFLDAMRAADAPTIETLLTTKAREETVRHQMPVEPVAAPHAQFQVAAPQYLPMNPNGAHVQAQWVESDGMDTYTHTVIWVLRRQTEGWRIAGFAIELIPGQGPQFLNFEDPVDMLQKQREAITYAEAAANKAAAEQAVQPLPPTGTQFK
jgi:hypothetical protein